MSLDGLPLLVLVSLLAVALPVALVLGWRRLPPNRVWLIARWGVVLLCQALAVAAVGVEVNRYYGFYDSWDDALGRKQPVAETPVQTGQLVPADGSEGRVVSIIVHGKVSQATENVLVWLPPQYEQKAYKKTEFPVLMALPGQPGSPSGVFNSISLAKNAMQAISAGVKPFIAVVPPLSIAEPRDTECTDIPHGPQADAWLATDVREAIDRHFRVTPDHWTALGWSTGGFCAAKMLLRHPTSFKAAVSIGGYFIAEQDHSTGSLFNHSKTLRNENSPIWLLQHTLTYPIHLLIVTSKGDSQSWAGEFYADTERTVSLSAGIPGVSAVVLPKGGHNWSTYGPTVEPSLVWLGQNAAL